jgi:hypothetical protein
MRSHRPMHCKNRSPMKGPARATDHRAETRRGAQARLCPAPSRHREAANAGRSVPTPPAVFPRPPVLVGDLSTVAVREALETLSANESTLERLAARGAMPDASDQDALARLAAAFLECWPVLDRARATAVLDALSRSEAQWPTVAREALAQSLTSARDNPALELGAWWRGAGAAGCAGHALRSVVARVGTSLRGRVHRVASRASARHCRGRRSHARGGCC